MRKSIIRIAAYTAFAVSCLIFFSGMAIAATSVSVLPSTQTMGPGEDFTLQIYVKPDTPIYGLQLDLTYDSSLVTINNIKKGDLFDGSGSPVMFNPGKINESTGIVSQIYSSRIMGDGTTNEGVFCTIDLVAESKYGLSEIRIKNLVLGNDQGKKLPATTFDSIITITDTSSTVDKKADWITSNTAPELSSIQAQDNLGSGNGERIFASTPVQAEQSNLTEASMPAFENSKIPDRITILFIAIAFFAIAYFLDRKK